MKLLVHRMCVEPEETDISIYELVREISVGCILVCRIGVGAEIYISRRLNYDILKVWL